ncbi:MAG: phosphoribosylformylglycinamidine synthase subunit PurQ [Clostridia bacterium]|nr:phosphoribosylformylglycinamidine synthase subunit PurQ [Clostridia bacterium]
MIKRIFVEKKSEYSDVYKRVKHIFEHLSIKFEDFRQFVRYDVDNMSDYIFDIAKTTIFSDPSTEIVYDKFPVGKNYQTIVVESVDSAYNNKLSDIYSNLIFLSDDRPIVKAATIYAISGISDEQIAILKDYLINKRFTKEGSMLMPTTLEEEEEQVDEQYNVEGFITYDSNALKQFIIDNNLQMDYEDLVDIQDYFKEEKRDPFNLEIKVLDTYLSGRVRHTTFNTKLTKIDIKSENPHIEKAYSLYKKLKEKEESKTMSLMDIATISKRTQFAKGKLKEVEQSEEDHCATIGVNVDVNGKNEKWWVSFKNETDNTQTEQEPFSGASTCIEGVLKDLIAERAYAYQGIRISGNSDPRIKDSEIKTKHSPYNVSRLSSKGAAAAANHFGLPISMVKELYHKGYRAKHLECAFVVGAAKQDNVIRAKEAKDDVIVIVGARTNNEIKIRKGDPLTLKKIQRLCTNEDATKLIKKAYDIGVGGIACALTEMIDLGVDLNLEYVPTTTENITGEEIAVSETQNRVLVLLAKDDVAKFIALANDENLEAVAIATITTTRRIRMYYDNKCLLDIKKSFFKENTKINAKAAAEICDPNANDFIDKPTITTMNLFEDGKFKSALLNELKRLEVCSQKGLNELYDFSIGSCAVLAQHGGRYQLTPTIASVQKLPVFGNSDTATAVTYGCIPNLLEKSPFLGAIYSIVLSLSKQVACGVDIDNVYLSLQEYFKKLKDEPKRWGEAVSAMLGALYAQESLGVYAIGGKDSMSGTFEDMDVPPTLISFALGVTKASKTISNVFEDRKEEALNSIYQVPLKRDEYGVPDFKYLKNLYKAMNRAIITGGIKACNVVEEGGVASAVFTSCMGNKLGTTWEEIFEDSYSPQLGDFIIQGEDLSELDGFKVIHIANINGTHTSELCGTEFKMSEAVDAYIDTIEGIYSTKSKDFGNAGNLICCAKQNFEVTKVEKPTVVIPILDGTLSDKDLVRAFSQAGANVEVFRIKNLTHDDVLESIDVLSKLIIDKAQMLAIPDGVRNQSKQLSMLFKDDELKDAVLDLVYKRNGLVLGIGSGFKALLDVGLLPYGKIVAEKDSKNPTLATNLIPKHISSVVRVRVATNKTPWLMANKLSEQFLVPVSHKEGRFVAPEMEIEALIKEGLVATQYVDSLGNATMTAPFNPNGSMYGIEGIISPDGKIFGKTGNAERIGENLYKNVEGNLDMKIFESGVEYFK